MQAYSSGEYLQIISGETSSLIARLHIGSQENQVYSGVIKFVQSTHNSGNVFLYITINTLPIN